MNPRPTAIMIPDIEITRIAKYGVPLFLSMLAKLEGSPPTRPSENSMRLPLLPAPLAHASRLLSRTRIIRIPAAPQPAVPRPPHGLPPLLLMKSSMCEGPIKTVAA